MSPLFLDSEQGRLFCLYFEPPNHTACSENLLIVPPFAEEMNKSRHMFAQLARKLSERGVAVMLLDLYGSGDSEGDFSEVRWEIWKQNVHQAAEWLTEKTGAATNLLGMRLGALLTLDAMKDFAMHPKRVLFWQPVMDGNQYITQFLRLRLAADMVSGDGGEKVTTKTLRQDLENGKTVEVAGYDLHPELVSAIDRLKLADLSEVLTSTSLHWFEIIANAERPLAFQSKKFIDAWKEQGRDIQVTPVVGETFWNTTEITMNSDLLVSTAEVFS